LANRAADKRLSLNADDVALFIRPAQEELQITKEILDCFGKASDLQTNIQKSCVIPIRYEEGAVQLVSDISSILHLKSLALTVGPRIKAPTPPTITPGFYGRVG
jgi:hypothetical protein